MKKNTFFPLFLLFTFHYFGITIANAQYTKLLDFSGTANGSKPTGDLVFDGTYLYGMTNFGGTSTFYSSNGRGVIFKIKPDGSSYSKLFDFDSTTNGGAHGSLMYDGTYLYGMTPRTFVTKGNIFKIKPDGTGYSTLLVFTDTNGSNPLGNLIYDGTFLYGMTAHGGINNCDQYGQGCGVIFKIKPDGTGYSKLHDFTITGGNRPKGSLIYDGTFLYGMTSAGGSIPCQNPHGCGVVFRIKPDGTGYTNLHDFDGITSGGPTGSLISDGTFLYGSDGTIFKIKPDGTGYSQLLSFTGANGSNSQGSLLYDGTFLYGMTAAGGAYGGTNGYGTIFRIKPDGTEYSKLFDFDGTTTGANPIGSLISDGTHLYGMTSAGGTNNMGVIFSFNLSKPTSINKALNKQTEINVFPNPTTSEITITIAPVLSRKEFIIKVTDPLSKIVYYETIKDVSGLFTKQIDLSSLPKGIYFVVVESYNSGNSKTALKEIRKIILQ
ncbi:MAG: choice-of-anchor tandem repeat GloVer-containing protein [Bacteroidia bacterium]